jgi:acetyl-CoA C-acetyltransferase
MSITVGWNAATRAGITREEMDAWALRSHERAIAGIDSGAFVDEIAPIEVAKGGETVTFAVDEHPRRGSSMEKLAGLKPLHPEIDGFSVTAGNASGVNDAAGAVMVVSAELAERLGLEPLAVIRSWASAGVPPAETGLAPIEAIPKAAQRAGIELSAVDLFEINEAFASVPIAAVKALGLDEEIVNVLGSGCSLGHPVGMTGVRMVMTTMNELRRRGGGIGLTAMCAGGGMASAVVFEVPKP